MVDYQEHLIYSAIIIVFLSITLIAGFDIVVDTYLLLLIPIWFTYTILPDIDCDTSIPFRIFKILCLILLACFAGVFLYTKSMLYLYLLVGVPAVYLFIKFLRHRGIMHTFYVGLLLSLPLLFVHWLFFFVASVSYISHLLIDGQLL